MSRVGREHARYLRDRARLDAFARALAEAVPPGRTIVDLGAGTGVLGMLACRAGAARVYAIESGPIAALARSLVRANALDDRVSVIRGRAADVTLPEPADAIVCDQIGRFGVDADIFTLMAGIRARFLAPGGLMLPHRIDVMAAPVEHAPLSRRVHDWQDRPAGLDFRAFGRMVANTVHPTRLRSSQLLAVPAAALSLDLTGDAAMPLRGGATFAIARDGVLHGIGAWFTARLSASVTMTNAPGAADGIDRQPVCFPIEAPVPVREGDVMTVAFRMVPSAPFYAWDVTVTRAGRPQASFAQHTLEGSPIDPADLRRPDSRPVLTQDGEARASILQSCDGHSTVQEIERLVYDRHRALFTTRADAGAFVAGVLARHARREG